MTNTENPANDRGHRTMRWNPDSYEKFAGPRLQPGIDLLSRLNPPEQGPIYDLGCGTGTLTARLAHRFGAHRVVGIDSSPAMLAKARDRYPDLTWREGDIGAFRADDPAAAIYSNAALHWLADHERLLPRLLTELAPDGQLAMQVPRNYEEAAFIALADLTARPEWRDKVGAPVRSILEPEAYFDLLAPLGAEIEIWQTKYLQVLEPPDAVFEYSRSTMLLPVLKGLDEALASRFSQVYRQALAEAYAALHYGKTLYSYNRLFLLLRK